MLLDVLEHVKALAAKFVSREARKKPIPAHFRHSPVCGIVRDHCHPAAADRSRSRHRARTRFARPFPPPGSRAAAISSKASGAWWRPASRSIATAKSGCVTSGSPSSTRKRGDWSRHPSRACIEPSRCRRRRSACRPSRSSATRRGHERKGSASFATAAATAGSCCASRSMRASCWLSFAKPRQQSRELECRFCMRVERMLECGEV